MNKTTYGKLFPVGIMRTDKMAGFNGTPKPSRSKPSGAKRVKPVGPKADLMKKGKGTK
jgi:hypothetical protein